MKCNVTYKKNQSFESFERELNKWKEATRGIPDHAKNLMFIEMLSNTDNEEVKKYYVKNVMNHDEVPKTIDSVMKKLKEKFSKSERQKWDELFEKVCNFKWNESSPKAVLDSLEVDRFEAMEVWKPVGEERANDESIYLLNKMLIRNNI